MKLIIKHLYEIEGVDLYYFNNKCKFRPFTSLINYVIKNIDDHPDDMNTYMVLSKTANEHIGYILYLICTHFEDAELFYINKIKEIMKRMAKLTIDNNSRVTYCHDDAELIIFSCYIKEEIVIKSLEIGLPSKLNYPQITEVEEVVST